MPLRLLALGAAALGSAAKDNYDRETRRENSMKNEECCYYQGRKMYDTRTGAQICDFKKSGDGYITYEWCNDSHNFARPVSGYGKYNPKHWCNISWDFVGANGQWDDVDKAEKKKKEDEEFHRWMERREFVQKYKKENGIK